MVGKGVAMSTPYTHKDGVRRNQVSFRCSALEYDTMDRAARAAGYTSHSEYIRFLVIHGPRLAEIERRLAALEANNG